MRPDLAAAITEKELLGTVRQLAEVNGWNVYHTHDSRRSDPGFPDLVLLRAPELIITELKTQKGRVSKAQQMWLDGLTLAGIEVRVWRPVDLPQIQARLSMKPVKMKDDTEYVSKYCQLGFHGRCKPQPGYRCVCNASDCPHD